MIWMENVELVKQTKGHMLKHIQFEDGRCPVGLSLIPIN